MYYASSGVSGLIAQGISIYGVIGLKEGLIAGFWFTVAGKKAPMLFNMVIMHGRLTRLPPAVGPLKYGNAGYMLVSNLNLRFYNLILQVFVYI